MRKLKRQISRKRKRVVVVDHFDSFTGNMVRHLILLGAKVYVVRTDSSVAEIERLRPTHIVLSAGEGHPKDVLLFHQVLAHFKGKVPIFGICLGEQVIGLHFNAIIAKCKKIMHGKTSVILHNGTGVFNGIRSRFVAMRYHSFAIKSFRPEMLRQNARTSDGTIMGVQSVEYPNVVGVQFHPESYFTEHGPEIFSNFLSMQ